MKTGEEGLVTAFLSPEELWNKTFNTVAEPVEAKVWGEQFANVPFEDKSGSWQLRYYQHFGRRGKHQQTVYRISGASLQTESSVMTGHKRHLTNMQVFNRHFFSCSIATQSRKQ